MKVRTCRRLHCAMPFVHLDGDLPRSNWRLPGLDELTAELAVLTIRVNEPILGGGQIRLWYRSDSSAISYGCSHRRFEQGVLCG